MLHVRLRGFGRVMRRVVQMSLRAVCVVRRCFVVACLVVFCRFPVMTRRVLVMLGCLMMMLCRCL